MRLRHAAITKGILAGIVLSGFLFVGAQAAGPVPFTDITTGQAAALIKEKGPTPLFILLDVRTPEEFSENRIKGAVNIDIRGTEFKEKVDKLNREGAYLVYCRGGVRSARAMGLMKEWGFKQVFNLAGGLMNWEREKLPLESGPAEKKNPASAPAQSEPIVSAEKIHIRSAVLNEERELRVATPSGYDQSQDAYPVLFVLDGDLNFAFTAEIARYLAAYRMIPPMIVVGVLNTERSRDMTHNQPVPAHARYANAGGADRFLKFLAEEAIPEIEKRYRALPERTLVGHSLSGMLTVYALLTRPDLFSGYIAISPSLWWNDFELLAKVQAFYKSRPTLKKKVFVSLADESEGDPAVYPRVKDAFERSAPKELAVFVQFFMEDNHISTAVASITSALQKLFSTR